MPPFTSTENPSSTANNIKGLTKCIHYSNLS